MDVNLNQLWLKVIRLTREAPYCYSSQRYAHRDAAAHIAKEEGLEREDLKAWQKFVNEKTLQMSNYAGD